MQRNLSHKIRKNVICNSLRKFILGKRQKPIFNRNSISKLLSDILWTSSMIGYLRWVHLMQKLPTEVKLQRVSSLRNSFYSCPTELLQSCGKVIRPATPLTKELCSKLSGNCLKIFKPNLFRIPLGSYLGIHAFIPVIFVFPQSCCILCFHMFWKNIFTFNFFYISVEKKIYGVLEPESNFFSSAPSSLWQQLPRKTK